MLICTYTECARASGSDFQNYINEIMDNEVVISYEGSDLFFFDKQTFSNITDAVICKMEEKLKQTIDEILFDDRTDEVIIIFGHSGGMM